MGASKLSVVQFVGNKFVCITVEGSVETREGFKLIERIKITYSINGNDTHSPQELALI